MRERKSQKLFLALLIGTGIIAGCSTPGNIPNNVDLNSNVPSNSNSSSSLNNTSSTVNISDLDSAKLDLASLHDDEATFSDSEALMNDSFSIKSEDNQEQEEKLLVTDDNDRPMPPMMDKRFMNKQPLRKMKRDDFKNFERENAKKLRDEFKNVKPRPVPKPMPGQGQGLEQAATLSSAITINDDGTITIDPIKLQNEVKKVLEARKKELEKRLSTINESLKKFKEVAKEKVNKLKRKNNVVRNTDKVVTENSDGTTTETMTVKFENTKQGIIRENTVIRTLKDGKLVSIDHSLKTTTKSYTRTSSRIVTFNEDGSKVIKTTSLTEWKDGRKVERNEERLVSASGNATGSGTITVTSKDGKVKTYQLNVSKTSSGELSSTVKDEETNKELQIVQDEQATVEVNSSENGNIEQKEVDLEQVITQV
ncbi:MAG: hypothetical protein KatS3mg068_2126 [Candidatus Sericytochromatia bacterium]|nr:MAG: hypothetical protein KatS3mg068_2126 [Candidatus Sericytochromatia bacterium]